MYSIRWRCCCAEYYLKGRVNTTRQSWNETIKNANGLTPAQALDDMPGLCCCSHCRANANMPHEALNSAAVQVVQEGAASCPGASSPPSSHLPSPASPLSSPSVPAVPPPATPLQSPAPPPLSPAMGYSPPAPAYGGASGGYGGNGGYSGSGGSGGGYSRPPPVYPGV